MKKLLMILFGAIVLVACKKEKAVEVNKTLQVIISNVPANTTYKLTVDQNNANANGIDPLLNITSGTESKTYELKVIQGRAISTNWSFTLNGQYKGTGKIQLLLDGQIVHSYAGYAGGYSFVVN